MDWPLSFEISAPSTVRAGQNVVATRGRLVRRVDGWPEAGDELAAWVAWRCRDRAADLWDGVDQAIAGSLRAATTIDELGAVVAGLPRDVGRPEQESTAYLAAVLAAGPNPVSACANAAQSAGHHALALGTVPAEAAFAAERQSQGWWLADRLALG